MSVLNSQGEMLAPTSFLPRNVAQLPAGRIPLRSLWEKTCSHHLLTLGIFSSSFTDSSEGIYRISCSKVGYHLSSVQYSVLLRLYNTAQSQVLKLISF